MHDTTIDWLDAWSVWTEFSVTVHLAFKFTSTSD